MKQADYTILTLSQGGLGLPDRDYYFDEDKEEKRAKYIEYIKVVHNIIYYIYLFNSNHHFFLL